jgi:hypothetical protein
MNLQVTEIGLFTFEKQSAFSDAYQKLYSTDLTTNKITSTHLVKCVLNLLQGVPSNMVFELDPHSLTFKLATSVSLQPEPSEKIQPC